MHLPELWVHEWTCRGHIQQLFNTLNSVFNLFFKDLQVRLTTPDCGFIQNTSRECAPTAAKLNHLVWPLITAQTLSIKVFYLLTKAPSSADWQRLDVWKSTSALADAGCACFASRRRTRRHQWAAASGGGRRRPAGVTRKWESNASSDVGARREAADRRRDVFVLQHGGGRRDGGHRVSVSCVKR